MAKVTAALRSTCFQELRRVRRSEAGIDCRKSQGHTQISCDLITSSGRMWVAPCFRLFPQPLVSPLVSPFFKYVREFVRRACAFHRERAAGTLSKEQLRKEESWIRERLKYLSQFKLAHPKAITLQGRINRHYTEWLIFIDDRRVPPTNNLAERALRPLVVLRKITFGQRSETGATTMAKLMTVAETARRHGHRASDIYFELLTRPPDQVMQRLYADASTPAK